MMKNKTLKKEVNELTRALGNAYGGDAHLGKSAWTLTFLLWVSLISIPDSSPRACGGVEYSFGGFSGWEDSEGLGLLFVARSVSW